MSRVVAVCLSMALALSAAPAHAGEEWKWGVNFYDLQIRSAVPANGVVEADICSAALTHVASMMLDVDPNNASLPPLRAIANAWREEGAKRREVDPETYSSKYLVPAFTLMDNLEDDDHDYWVQRCMELTRKSLPPG